MLSKTEFLLIYYNIPIILSGANQAEPQAEGYIRERTMPARL